MGCPKDSFRLIDNHKFSGTGHCAFYSLFSIIEVIKILIVWILYGAKPNQAI